MITFFNKLGNSWVAKFILGLLALSMMAFWGLGGLTNLNTYNNEAITIGKISISTNQVMRTFDEERKNLSQQLGGKYISPVEAINLGLLQKVIQDTIVQNVKYQIKEDLEYFKAIDMLCEEADRIIAESYEIDEDEILTEGKKSKKDDAKVTNGEKISSSIDVGENKQNNNEVEHDPIRANYIRQWN